MLEGACVQGLLSRFKSKKRSMNRQAETSEVDSLDSRFEMGLFQASGIKLGIEAAGISEISLLTYGSRSLQHSVPANLRPRAPVA